MAKQAKQVPPPKQALVPKQAQEATQEATQEGGDPEKGAEADRKRLPFLMRPLHRIMTNSPAAVRGICIALAVYWMQQLARYLGWME
jgi:hypothetical protein